MYRINTHQVTLVTRDDTPLTVWFDLVWREQDAQWYLESVDVDSYEPDGLPKREVQILLTDYIDEYGFGPYTPYEGEADEEIDSTD